MFNIYYATKDGKRKEITSKFFNFLEEGCNRLNNDRLTPKELSVPMEKLFVIRKVPLNDPNKKWVDRLKNMYGSCLFFAGMKIKVVGREDTRPVCELYCVELDEPVMTLTVFDDTEKIVKGSRDAGATGSAQDF